MKEHSYVLKKHAKYSSKTLTPFISTDMSVYNTLARAKKKIYLERGPVQITLIDNAVRTRLGYPFFHMKEEMKYYAVEDPYEYGYEYYKTEIIYPYIITPEEIVAVWKWSDVKMILESASSGGASRCFMDELVHPALKKKYETDFSLSLDLKTGAIIAEELLETMAKDTIQVDNDDPEDAMSGIKSSE